MNTVTLDTSAVSDFQRKSLWLNSICLADKVLIPFPVLGELKYGIRSGSHYKANINWLNEFLSSPLVDILESTCRTTDLYAELKQQLKHAGTPIPENDIWIAACCIENSSVLLTRDNHFKHIPQLNVLWP